MENHLAVDALACPADDQAILDNIDGRLHGPMSGFMKRYFGSFEYVYQNGSLEIQAAEGLSSSQLTVPAATAPSPDEFLNWFADYVSREAGGGGGGGGARGSWHITCEHENDGDDGAGARLLLTTPVLPTDDVQTRWDHVQVIGQFYDSDGVCYPDGLLRLCQSAHQVFASQPTRLFLHGFYIRGSLIELWMFDRSGLYCSDLFDIQKDFIRFLSIILSYQRMPDDDLGQLSIIQADDTGNYIILDSVATPSLGKLYLESQPIASSETLVGTGTTCYRARLVDSNRWDYILKFKWRWARDRPEDELLRLAKKSSVWGAVSVDYYQELESTANLRRGLRWGTHRRLARSPFHNRDDANVGAPCKTGLADFTEETDNYFQNRILACIVTSPVGRPLHTFQTILELLRVFRDAIKCHRSLLTNAKILHQDISAGNIIILDGQDEEKPRGILIDLDSAIELTEEEEEGPEAGPASITGTRPFMAIGVLKRERHTYRHDLESFLYVFLWTVITNHGQDPPETSKLRQWSNGGNWNELADRKSLDMTDKKGFQTILSEFTAEFQSLKPLAESLRQVLFANHDGVNRIWTDSSPEAVDKLYNGMVHALDAAIASELRR